MAKQLASFRLTTSMIQNVNQFAEQSGMKKTEIIEEALSMFLQVASPDPRQNV